MLGSRVSRPRSQGSTVRRPQARKPQQAKSPRPMVLPTARQQVTASPGRRPFTLLVFVVLIAGALSARLVFWQVMEHTHLAAVAAEEQSNLLVQPAMRGQIYDSSGTPLALDVVQNLIYAVPDAIKDPHTTADSLAPILGVPRTSLEAKLEDRVGAYARYIQLSPRVSSDVSARIKALRLPGIFLTPEMGRAYPEGSRAAQVLGYTDLNGNGNNGIEGYYNGLLSGTTGLRAVLKDTAGHDVRLGTNQPVAPHDGANLYLSLDGIVQSFVERDLARAVKQHQADAGTIIVMDPHTGYILGMASTPSYDPNSYWSSATDESRFLNPAVQWTYEPGSTFKILTMAAGLDAHVVTPDTAFDDTGAFTVGDVTLHNWNLSGFGWETMTQVLQHSANVGASFVAQRLGSQRFYQYMKRFGVGQRTGVDLAGEEQGLFPQPGDKNWTIVNQYTNSFGQGVSITPMQLIRVVAAVANGGQMMKPQIVKEIAYRGRIIDHPPVSQGQVMSPDTARTLTSMLVKSAIGGEASLGLVKGYDVAAKTGTANIAENGRYLENATIASITGYAPAYNPKFVALVILRHPRDTIWGSMAAAPVLHDLFQELFWHYHVPPSSHALNQ